MKHSALLYFLLIFLNLPAQELEPEKAAVQKTIETFFEGFHRQDSTILKSVVAKDIILQTISKTEKGKAFVSTENFSNFLKSITGIPEDTKFQEIIKGYSIQVDGPMANAWTPYEFRIDEAFQHCGVNSFQLFKDDDDWKIIYLIDSSRKVGCQ